jgi:ferredoxin
VSASGVPADPAWPAKGWPDVTIRPPAGRRPARNPVPTGPPAIRTELVVDRIACDGFGMCAELLPELIELDDWGYPMIRDGGVPRALMDHAKRAVAVCPVLALRVAKVSTAPVERGQAGWQGPRTGSVRP